MANKELIKSVEKEVINHLSFFDYEKIVIDYNNQTISWTIPAVESDIFPMPPENKTVDFQDFVEFANLAKVGRGLN